MMKDRTAIPSGLAQQLHALHRVLQQQMPGYYITPLMGRTALHQLQAAAGRIEGHHLLEYEENSKRDGSSPGIAPQLRH